MKARQLTTRNTAERQLLERFRATDDQGRKSASAWLELVYGFRTWKFGTPTKARPTRRKGGAR